jgi:hypothetical protein
VGDSVVRPERPGTQQAWFPHAEDADAYRTKARKNTYAGLDTDHRQGRILLRDMVAHHL